MPLLDNKPYVLAKKPKDLHPWDKQYTIPVTGEVFRTQDEYIKKVALYSAKNWTCRCTGKANLTFREALDSEKTAEEALREIFPTHFEKIACELTHHSTLSIEHLTEQVSFKISQTFVVGELVELKVKVKSKVVRGKIIKVEAESHQLKTPVKQTGSPSSDKENFTGDKQQSHSTTGNIFCNIKLVGEEKVIGSVPARELVRLEEIPSKEAVELFLKTYTLQSDCQNNKLWVVSDHLIKKYNLVNKFPEFLLAPYKVQFDYVRKRKSEPIDSPSKKIKTNKSEGQTDLFAYYSKEGSPEPSSSGTSPVYLDHTYSSPASKNKHRLQFDKSGDENGTSNKKSQPDSRSKIKNSSVKLEKMPSKQSTLKVNLFRIENDEKKTVNVVDTESSSDSDDDIPLQKLALSPISLKQKQVKKTEAASSDEDVPLIKISRDEIKSNWREIFKNMSKEKAKMDRSKDEKKNGSKRKSKKSKESEKKKKRDKSKKSPLKHSSKTTPKKVSTKRKTTTPVKLSKKKSKESSKKTLSKAYIKTTKSKENTPKKSSKSPKNKKSMKQMTLFDIGSKKKANNHDSSDDSEGRYQIVKLPPKSPKSPRPRTPKMPGIVQKLIGAKRSNKKPQYIHYLSMCARQLTTAQKNHLNPLVKDDVIKKHEEIQKKIKWNAMSAEDKKAFLKVQREERNKVIREAKNKQIEEAKKERLELAKRYEDQELILKPLIMPKPVELPEGLPNTRFGDVAMVVEFLNMYSGLLMPDDQYPISAENLILALASGPQGFSYLSRCLVILLKTLLQDDIAEDYSELGMKLSGIPVNLHTASELMRLCLRPNDQETDDSDTDEEIHQDVDNDVPQHLVEKLDTKEFYELEADEKIVLLICLCHRIMSSYSVIDFMEDKQRDATQLWKEKMKTLKEKNDRVKEEKKKIKEEKEALRIKKEEEENKGAAATNENKEQVKKEEVNKTDNEEKEEEIIIPDDENDLITVIKRRRMQSAKMKVERAEQEVKERERRIKDQEEMRKQKEAESFEKKFEDGIQLAKSILRNQPLGVDRNHSRYWLFSSVVPGLFVEKGWACKDIGRSFKDGDDSDTDSDDSDLPTEGLEFTIPKIGQNMWFQYETQKELDSLVEVVNNQGMRESHLYIELKKNYQDIVKSLNLTRKSSPGLRACNGPEDLLAAFKEDLLDEEQHIRQGNLGGVEAFEVWEQSLKTAEDLETLGALLIETQSSTNPRFLQGVMAMKKQRVRLEENDTDDPESDEPKVPVKILKWREAVENPSTISRLHVLLGIFEASVKWEKSAENAKCKICRKKGDDRLLLCDDCNQPFHLLCLRPALKSIPKGEWKCPSCKPQTPRRVSRNRVVIEDDGEESDYQEEEEQYCCVCEEQGQLLTCYECESYFHRDCHEPPLRNFPRGKWICNDCTHFNGRKKNIKSKRVKNARKNAKKKPKTSRKRIQYDDDDDESDDQLATTKRAKPAFETRILEDIIYRLNKSKDSAPFRKPIDKKEAKKYYKVVKNPVDLQTIKTRTLCLEYNTYESFITDIKLIFSNAELYYKVGSNEVKQVNRLEQLFIETLERLIPNLMYSRTTKDKVSNVDKENTSDKNHNTRKRRKVCL